MREETIPATDTGEISADRPIERPREDKLGRNEFARVIAAQVVAPRREEGFVLAVTGPWGGGKTSTLRLVEGHLGDEVVLVRFNPWLFGGGDDLALRFLAELTNQLPGPPRFKGLRKTLLDYAGVLTPLRGAPGAGAEALKKVLNRSAEQERDAVSRALAEVPRRVLVVVDDIDRLPPTEVADVVRFVKLVGDFPNVTYLLAYDRQQVEESLSKALGGSGRDYLDKIVQASYPLPHVEQGVLAALLTEALDTRLRPGVSEPEIKVPGERWPTILTSIITPLLRTLRDVRRLANIAPTVVHLTQDDVAVEDVLALETLRVLLPDVYDLLPQSVQALTRNPRVEYSGAGDDDDKQRLETLLEAAGDRSDVARAVIRHLFPAAERHLSNTTYGPEESSQWRRERRVATRAGLLTYLTKALGEHAVRAVTIRAVLDAVGDQQTFEDQVAGVPNDQLADLLVRIRDSIDAIPSDPATTSIAIANFFNLMPSLPEQRRTLLDIDAEFLVAPLAGNLLVRLPEGSRDGVVEDAFETINSLYGKFRLVQWFGDHDHADDSRQQPLMSREVTRQLRGRVRDALLAASPADFLRERQFARLVGVLVRDGGERGTGRLHELVEDDDFMLRLLVSFASRDVEEDLEGSVIAQRGVTLDWETLGERIGRDLLSARVRSLQVALTTSELSEDEQTVLQLAIRHASVDDD